MRLPQATLRRRATFAGIGVHSGRPATVHVEPAPADTGIVFRLPKRVRWSLAGLVGTWPADPASAPCVDVPARHVHVAATRLQTVLRGPGTVGIGTVEHLLSALAGLGVDNARIVPEAGEIPIMDGSAAPFVAGIDAAGIDLLERPRRLLKVLRPVRAAVGDSEGVLEPSEDERLTILQEIDFPDAAIGRQTLDVAVTPDSYRREIAPARTFGRVADLERLRRRGFGRGASLENAVGVDGPNVVNPEGLRFPDEFVRHKMLDSVGDLALAGLPLVARYRSVRGGHRLNHAVLEALHRTPHAVAVVEATA